MLHSPQRNLKKKKILKISNLDMSLKFTYVKLQSHLPGVSLLMAPIPGFVTDDASGYSYHVIVNWDLDYVSSI